MLAVIQRISRGNVSVDGEVIASCDGVGLMILLGVTHGDTEEDAFLLADKIVKLRIFSDADDKMNLSVLDVGGGIIAVSQFTLYASYRKGNRPDYMNAAPPEIAEPLYNAFVERLKTHTERVSCGRFGAHMMLDFVNDGPVTIPMDSAVLRQPKRDF